METKNIGIIAFLEGITIHRLKNHLRRRYQNSLQVNVVDLSFGADNKTYKRINQLMENFFIFISLWKVLMDPCSNEEKKMVK